MKKDGVNLITTTTSQTIVEVQEPWNYEIIDFNCEEILWDLIEVGTLTSHWL